MLLDVFNTHIRNRGDENMPAGIQIPGELIQHGVHLPRANGNEDNGRIINCRNVVR